LSCLGTILGALRGKKLFDKPFTTEDVEDTEKI
jgi:hypothetical protein